MTYDDYRLTVVEDLADQGSFELSEADSLVGNVASDQANGRTPREVANDIMFVACESNNI